MAIDLHHYGVATISRLLEKNRSLLQKTVTFIRLLCKSDLLFEEPTNCSHPISVWLSNFMTIRTTIKLHHYPYVYRTTSISEYCLFYRAVLQKRLIILRSLLIVGTQYLYGYRTS